jgi:hypothetical protein
LVGGGEVTDRGVIGLVDDDRVDVVVGEDDLAGFGPTGSLAEIGFGGEVHGKGDDRSKKMAGDTWKNSANRSIQE